MPFLQTLRLDAPGDSFPLSLPVFENFGELSFTAAVTFLVGENGCGKSTLLEIIAAGLKLPSLTQRQVAQHPLMAAARDAAKAFRFVRGAGATPRGRRRGGFFFRADDVVGFLQAVQRNAEEHRELAGRFAREMPAGWGRDRAVGMARAQAGALAERYGDDPFAQSHGELFLSLFQSRVTAPGLYLMDEPEAPLSPGNQIALLALILDAASRGSQFIIATHAPILMALPDAVILNVDASPPEPIDWNDVEHVSLTRAFLNHPESFLRRL